MGEHIRAGIDCLHTNGNTYHITEVRQAGGRTVAVGYNTGPVQGVCRNVILAVDKLSAIEPETGEPTYDEADAIESAKADAASAELVNSAEFRAETPREEVLGTDCVLTAQDMANLTGNRWEDSYPAVPTPSPETTPPAVVRFHSSFSAHPSPDGTAYVVETRNGRGIGHYGFPTLEQAIRYAAERNGDNPDPTDPTDPTPSGWDTVDTSTDNTPARPLAPNSDASPITTDDLRQCRRELRRKVAIHCAGESVMTAGSLSVALRTLAALDRSIGGETAPRPATGMPGTFSGPCCRSCGVDAEAIGPGPACEVCGSTLGVIGNMPSEPGPLGIYDRQGNAKRSRRRRRHEDRSRAPRSIFRARADRKPRPSVHGGQAPTAPFSAN